MSTHACASVHKETASASVQTDDLDIAALAQFFNTLPMNDQMRVLSNLFLAHMLNSFGINVPDDFLSYAANTMFQLRLGQRTNVLYNLAKGIGTLRADNSDSRFPTKRMPMGIYCKFFCL